MSKVKVSAGLVSAKGCEGRICPSLLMVTFLGHLDWVLGCPNIWLDIISEYVCEDASGRGSVFELVDWIEQTSLFQCGWASSHPLKAWMEKKGRGMLNWFSAWDISLGLGLTSAALLVTRPSGSGWKLYISFQESPTFWQQIVQFSASIITWAPS